MDVQLNPVITHTEQTETGAIYTLQVSRDLAFFEHHFHDFPIVPGVSQFQWVMDLLAEDNLGDFCGISKLKYNRPIYPGTTVSLLIEIEPEKKHANFRYFDDAGSLSSGQILFN